MDFTHYSEKEYENWKEFKKVCFARIDNLWIMDTCNIRNDNCIITKCFAHQLVKLLKGYF